MPLSLVEFKGRFPVGASTFVARLSHALTIGSAKLRPLSPHHTPQPALNLEEIAFTLYYPANTTSDGSRNVPKGLDWLIRCATFLLTRHVLLITTPLGL
jgi:hypothetical protein